MWVLWCAFSWGSREGHTTLRKKLHGKEKTASVPSTPPSSRRLLNLGTRFFWVVASCQNPLLGNVLSSSPHCIHERNQEEIQIKLNNREETPPEELIQNARIKVAPKIHVWIPKSPIIECDHNKSGLGIFPCSRNFGKIKQWHENI